VNSSPLETVTPSGAAPARPRAARYAAAYVGGVVLWSAADMALRLNRLASADRLHLLLGLALNLLIVLWVARDARMRGGRRGPGLTACLVAFGILALAYYLIRSRQGAARKRALLAYLALLAGAVGANLAGKLLAWSLAG